MYVWAYVYVLCLRVLHALAFLLYSAVCVYIWLRLYLYCLELSIRPFITRSASPIVYLQHYFLFLCVCVCCCIVTLCFALINRTCLYDLCLFISLLFTCVTFLVLLLRFQAGLIASWRWCLCPCWLLLLLLFGFSFSCGWEVAAGVARLVFSIEFNLLRFQETHTHTCIHRHTCTYVQTCNQLLAF